MEFHIVQKGDTLWKISREHGISFEDLKRVNAHLANPDYIVPGMKIFLPSHVKKQEKKKEETPAIKKTVTPIKEEVKEVKPVPEKPKAVEPKPKKKPKQVQPRPEKPIQETEPKKNQQHVPPVEMQPTQPMQPYPPFQMIGIPCGWLPIYDADCYPHVHPNHMQPMPPPMTQLPIHPESSHSPNHGHKQEKPKMPKISDSWEHIEPPKPNEGKKEHLVPPKVKPEMTAEPKPMPLPQAHAEQYEMPMQQHHWGCMHCGGRPNYIGDSLQCSCGSFQQLPYQHHQQHQHQYQHQYHQYHCNACHQPMPPMMAYPIQSGFRYGIQ